MTNSTTGNPNGGAKATQKIASGHGIATISQGATLDVWFPSPSLSALPGNIPAELLALKGEDKNRGVQRELVSLEIDLAKAPENVADVYLRIPSGVRIADADRVRLGAHLATGTTVMHEGFVNFNAGTLGSSMVEGRISAGVIVGDGTDIGGGASIMGTLSGGGKEVISIGEKCLLGANSGTGISLGDNCVIEAGVYITASAKIKLPDGEVVKAKSLSGASNLLFRRNSVDGALEAVLRTGTWGGLNSVLHAN